jgi:hypothetical protein
MEASSSVESGLSAIFETKTIPINRSTQNESGKGCAMTDDSPMDREPAQPASPPCEECAADDYRCSKAATCPNYRNPATPTVERIRATLDKLKVISASTREAIAALKVDLESPVPDETFRDLVPRVLAFLTYLGVGVYVLSVLYLSAYYDRVAPGVAISYPYVETIGAALSSGVLALLLAALAPAVWFFSSALGVSRTTRELLHTVLNQIVEAHVELGRAELAISELGQFLSGIGSSPDDDAQTDDVCESLRHMTADQRDLLNEQTELVTRLVSSVPLMTRIPILLAREFRLHTWVWAPLGVAVAVACVLPLAPAIISAYTSSMVTSALLRLIAVLLVLLAGAMLWIVGSTCDLAVGPRTRRARSLSAALSTTFLVIVVSLFIWLGSAAGLHDYRFPASSFAVVTAQTDAGQVFSGYAVPVLGSADVYVLAARPAKAGRTITRIPAATLRSIATRWP